MIPPSLLRLAALMISATVVLGGPAQARSDGWIDPAAPRWVDQTVYRPNCLPADCACDCRSERLCLPACVRW